jgi:hypothetical protein
VLIAIAAKRGGAGLAELSQQLILQAGERISRILGYSGAYPPRSQGEAPAD